MSEYEFSFGDVWQYVLADGTIGAEVQIITVIPDKHNRTKRVWFFKPRANQVANKPMDVFLADYRPTVGYEEPIKISEELAKMKEAK